MPSLANEKDSSRVKLIELLNRGNETVSSYPEQFDEIEIDITGKGDNSYLLYGIANKNGDRVFQYSRS